MTSGLLVRVQEHKEHKYKKSFTARYNVEYLVYEKFGRVTDAIVREKQIKKWSNAKKVALVNSMNPEWRDLWEEMV
jgi:putative endonuclease